MLYMVIANFADALVAPAAAGLTIALHDTTHPQVLRCADHGCGSCAFWCECKYIRRAGFLQFPTVRETPELLDGEARVKSLTLTWIGLSTRGLSSAITVPSRNLAIASKAPRPPPLYIFSGSRPSPLDTVSYESDSKSSNDRTASPRDVPFLPPTPKSISVRFTYLRPARGGGSLFPDFELRWGGGADGLGMGSGSSASRASPCASVTGARLTRIGLRSATTAIVTQSPTTGTSYACPRAPAPAPGYARTIEYNLDGET